MVTPPIFHARPKVMPCALSALMQYHYSNTNLFKHLKTMHPATFKETQHHQEENRQASKSPFLFYLLIDLFYYYFIRISLKHLCSLILFRFYIAVEIKLLMNIKSCDFPSNGKNIGINEKYFKRMLLYQKEKCWYHPFLVRYNLL